MLSIAGGIIIATLVLWMFGAIAEIAPWLFKLVLVCVGLAVAAVFVFYISFFV